MLTVLVGGRTLPIVEWPDDRIGKDATERDPTWGGAPGDNIAKVCFSNVPAGLIKNLRDTLAQSGHQVVEVTSDEMLRLAFACGYAGAEEVLYPTPKNRLN